MPEDVQGMATSLRSHIDQAAGHISMDTLSELVRRRLNMPDEPELQVRTFHDLYLEVRFTYDLISNCSDNLIIRPITTATRQCRRDQTSPSWSSKKYQDAITKLTSVVLPQPRILITLRLTFKRSIFRTRTPDQSREGLKSRNPSTSYKS